MNEQTEIIDRLLLELSQFTNATTNKELTLKRRIANLEKIIYELNEKLMECDGMSLLSLVPRDSWQKDVVTEILTME